MTTVYLPSWHEIWSGCLAFQRNIVRRVPDEEFFFRHGAYCSRIHNPYLIMRSYLRTAFAIIVGIITSGVVILITEMLSHSLLGNGSAMPNPEDAAAVAAYAEQMPFGILFSLLLAWCGGAFAGSLVASKLAPSLEKLVTTAVGVSVLGLTVMNFFQFPHPTWLMISAVLLIPVASWLAIPRGPSGRRSTQ